MAEDQNITCRGEGAAPAVNLSRIEKELLKHPQDFEAPVYHHFGPGLYIRELHVPAGVIGMGHFQKMAHMNNFVKGRVLMLNDDGSHTEMAAPMTFMGKPGRKVVYVIEDMVWQNIYPTDETDIEILEETYLQKSPESVEFYAANDLVEDVIKEIRDDFTKAIKEYGFTAEYVREQSENKDDLVDMPSGYSSTCVLNSQIEGKGFFASASFGKGDLIAPAVVGGKRTPASRYTNHSPKPNAQAKIMFNGDIVFMACRDIKGCLSGSRGEEITIDYRHAMDYRNKLIGEAI